MFSASGAVRGLEVYSEDPAPLQAKSPYEPRPYLRIPLLLTFFTDRTAPRIATSRWVGVHRLRTQTGPMHDARISWVIQNVQAEGLCQYLLSYRRASGALATRRVDKQRVFQRQHVRMCYACEACLAGEPKTVTSETAFAKPGHRVSALREPQLQACCGQYPVAIEV